MKKCGFIPVILEPYADWEAALSVSSALYMLGRGRFEVKTGYPLTREPVASISGFHVLPDYDIEFRSLPHEALVLIGGLAWRNEGRPAGSGPSLIKCRGKRKGFGRNPRCRRVC